MSWLEEFFLDHIGLFTVVVTLGIVALMVFSVVADNSESYDCQPTGNIEKRSVYTHSITVGKVTIPQYQTRRVEEYFCRHIETGESKYRWMKVAK